MYAKTTNTAPSALGGSGLGHVTDVTVTTSTDNVLLINSLGVPFTKNCSNKQGGTWCYLQNYKAAVPNQYTGKTGNIDWNYSILDNKTGGGKTILESYQYSPPVLTPSTCPASEA